MSYYSRYSDGHGVPPTLLHGIDEVVAMASQDQIEKLLHKFFSPNFCSFGLTESIITLGCGLSLYGRTFSAKVSVLEKLFLEDRSLARLIARTLLHVSAIMPELLSDALAVPQSAIPDSKTDAISARMNSC